ncbi:MAG: FAD-dependent monooxygenase [Thermomicrobiales bacterium]
MPRRILISGASVAGNALAALLTAPDDVVTVVERAPAFRDGGQNVDVRGAARTVLQRMGLEQSVADHGTGEAGLRFVHADDSTVAEFAVADMGGEGFTAELEILRGDLARLLYERAQTHATYRFGDAITALTDGPDGVQVQFANNEQECFDLVVVAEGVGSDTRELVFPGENKPRWIDVTMGYCTIPAGHGDGEMARWFTAGEGRSVLLRPDPYGTTRAVLTVQGPARDDNRRDPEAQKAWLHERFADAGWETPRVLEGLAQTTDFYFDVLRQVKMPRWSSGRVVLCGDAAWCATPLAGAGTSLALIGAYVLAGELATDQELGAALAAYARVMQPFVEEGQDVPAFGARLAQPQTRWGVQIQSAVLGIAATPPLRPLLAKVFTPDADERALPDYRVLEPVG